MDQVLSDRLRDSELRETEWQSILAALGNGLIVVRSSGEIVWMDEKKRRRVNGGLQNLDLPIRKSEGSGVDCFVTVARVTINGESSVMCAIHEANDQQELGNDLIAAVEVVMADTSRAIIDKLRVLHQATQHTNASSLEHLTQREREVLMLICEGHSDAKMARILGLSPNTVRNHIASLFRKIGVNRRSAAIIWARERAISSRDALGVKRRVRQRTDDKAAAC